MNEREHAIVLLESKLRPPIARTGVVERPRLLKRLTAARRTPLLVLEGSAGYGKTLLAADWARADGRAVSWYSIDERDNQPSTFLTYLGTALARAGAPVEDVLTRIAVDPGDTSDAASALADAFASLEEGAVVVVDNVHRLVSERCLDTLVELVAHVPDGSQLVLVTRRALPDELAAEAAKRNALHLGIEELRLTDAETVRLVAAVGPDVTLEEAQALNVRCEGWPALLYLVALVGRPALERLWTTRGGDVDEFVAEYIRLELLEGLPDEERRFLLDIAALELICVRVCEAVLETNNADERLTSLTAAHLLVATQRPTRITYRMHPLLRDVLRSELAQDAPKRLQALRQRAINWYEANSYLNAAVETAIDLGARDRLAVLVAHAMLPAFSRGEVADVERWLATLDDADVIGAHPETALIGAALFGLIGKSESADRWARLAYDTDPSRTMPDGSPASAWIANLRALRCADGPEQMRADAETTLATLAVRGQLTTSALLCRAYASLLLGDDAEAVAPLREAAAVGREFGATIATSLALGGASILAAREGDATAASELAQKATTLVETSSLGTLRTSALAHTATARAALMHHNLPAAREAAAQADALFNKVTYAFPWFAVFTRLELAQVHLALEQPARARELLEEVDMILGHRPQLGVLVDAAAELRHNLAVGHSDTGWASPLTPAEWRLLPLLATHLSFREIAERLSVSRNTVKTQAIAVYRELGVSSRSAAVQKGRDLGYLKSGDRVD